MNAWFMLHRWGKWDRSEFDKLNKKLFKMKNAATSPAARNQVTQTNEKLSRLAHQTALAMFDYVKNGDTKVKVVQKGKVFK